VERLALAGTLAPSWEVNNLSDPQRLSGWARKGIAVAEVGGVSFDFIDAEASVVACASVQQ
jgi:hypothetical protein